jgi:pimeloyl-ACP methyl ester carboxylesterase
VTSIWTDLLGARVHYPGARYRTRVIESGEGPALVLLHGIGGHAEAYSRNVMRLGQGHRAMAIDFLWHGYSSRPPYVDGASIEGESLGGWVGLWLALEHPDRVDRLILNTTAGIAWSSEIKEDHTGGRSALAERSLAAIDDPNPERIRKRLEWLMASPDRVTDELVDVRVAIYSNPDVKPALRTVFEHAFGGIGKPRTQIPEERLPEIAAPTLVLWTDHNPGTGPDVGRKIAAAIPGAQFACMADSAHWPQWEHPEEHDDLVLRFLSGETVHQD